MEFLAHRAPWYLAGPLIGALIVLFLWVTNQPFGALGGYIELDEWVSRRRSRVGWRTWFVAGVIAGGFVSSIVGAGWHPTLGYGAFDRAVAATLPLKAAVLFGAGLLMGAGGRMAGGCTSGHGLCGTSFGSRASFVCTGTFMATAIAASLATALLFGAR